MKATKWQRAVSLLLCLLMAMSFLTVTAPKAYAADDATATVQVDWPQLKSLKIKDGYFYDGTTAAASTFACKVKDIEITNYESIHTNEEGLAGTKVIGEVCITVMDPVKVENGTLTKTSADYPDELRVAKKGYSGETTVTGASLYVKNILYAKRVTGETYYGDGVGILPTIRIDNGTQKYYYHLKIVPVTETAENTPPTIKEGVENPVTIDVTVNTAWQLDLTSIFEDADKDTLTYYVKIGDAEAVATGANYSYRPEAAGMTTLVFTAYDGKAYSQEYKVTLNATATVQVDWPQLKSLKIEDGYFYDGTTAAASTFACKVKDIEITNYESIHTNEEGLAGTKVIGEVCITVMDPVKVENGTLTKTSADYPDELRVAKKGYSGETTVTGASLYVKNILYAKRVTGETYYGDGVGILPTIRIDNGTQKYYYHLKIVPVTETAENTPPTIKEGVENPVTIDVTVNTAWQLDLTSIFEDADKDTLTYYVKIGDAEAVATGANYSYRPEAAGMTTLVFTAYDGKAYSQEYKVTLNATAGETQSYEITTTAEGTYSLYESSKSAPMGSVEVEVNGTSSNKAKTGDTVVVKAVSQKFGVGDNNFYDAKLDKWEVTGIPGLSDSKLKEARLEFTMPNNDVSLKAVFVKAGSAVTLTANFPVASDLLLTVSGITIAATYDVNSGKQHKFDSVADTVAIGTEVSATIAPVSNPKTGNKLVGWEITNTTKEETVSVEYKDYPTQIGTIQRPYFTVDGTSNYTIKAIFAAKDYGDVNVTVNDESMGTATAQIGSEEAATKLFGVVEGTEVKLQAQPKTGYVFQSWSATYGSDNTQVDIANSTATQTTFLMPETNHQAVNVVATFAEDPNYLSEACDLEKVALLDANGSPVGEYDQDGTVFTITLPADMDTTNLANMILKLTYSKNAQVFKEGSKTAWDANGQACNMTLGTATKFIVRSQKDLAEGDEGPTQEYTITIQQAAAPGTPTLSNGSATRSSKTAATVKFTTNEAGTYYYKVVNHGAAAPTADEIMKSTTKGTASAGETTFTLSNLTEDARDIYIVVVSAAGGESAPLKVEIPAYGSGTDTPDTGAYKISISAPKGGTITTNRTKADKGDEIIVTVTPDNGYQMVSGSLTYTLAKEGGETKTITNNRFTMPVGDVSITCKWETATTTAKGITSFSINGVAGAVNNSTNTITITMPRGTDVTKLTPVIATNGVKSLTPGNGETVNFTNAVTYTVAMEDGSSKTYTVTVYVDKGTLADQFWDKLTDFATQVPWWQYAEKQQSTSKYPKYW